MEQEILEKLELDQNFRERKNKNLIIAQMLKEKYQVDIEVPRLKAIIEDASSMDRYWRLHTRNNKHLQGKDYGTKQKVVQEKQIVLGYEAGYNQEVKKLKQITADEEYELYG